ncbi:cysteine-rich with EGF-like domain protein 2 [Chrysoperla carnea]|uniref:cysteine-rich with EGF-like domain protein 2 n=1 Tax=Chrysoperla carnea TaxID=189513 RepID=UPI001D05D0D0|nr:cysteine-rich with EGF-like domain protein 2 [Chrysoperla carnea]
MRKPYLICFTFGLFLFGVAGNDPKTKEALRTHKYPPCKLCRVVVESFQKGMERTARGKFEGGDTDWEEKKLGSYMDSEVRLVEIQEGLCRDLDRGEDQCHDFAGQYESVMESWWFNKEYREKGLDTYMCIEEVKVCCPNGHYGPECLPCNGYPDNICTNNGKCKGNGTRKGNGLCACDAGYTGEICNECNKGYFQVYKDDHKVICDKCHESCKLTCKEGGPRGCDECSTGWYHSDKGCIDINECVKQPDICERNQFCVNSPGSYKCLNCDPSCETCSGDGPDMCDKCASGYRMENNFCIEKSKVDRAQYVNLTRYLTYLGLCLATCIIFQRSMLFASIIGLAVGLYISVAEYMLANENHTGINPAIPINDTFAALDDLYK